MTLIELLVVLTILVILTTIAITSTSQVMDQGRYDATQRTLQNIQDAIVGPANQRAADGSLLITGFVADMGRLPQTVDATSEPLRELWDASVIPATSAYGIQTFPNATITSAANSTTAFGLVNAAGTPYNPSTASVALTVTLPAGWRGPYLQLATGSSGRLLDGWGNPFDSLSQGLPPAITLTSMTIGLTNPFPQSINAVRSRGADGTVDANPLPATFSAYNVDQYVPAQQYVLTPTQTLVTPLLSFSGRTTGSVNVAVKTIATTGGVSALSDPSSFADTNGTYMPCGSSCSRRSTVYYPAFILDNSNVSNASNPTTNPITDLNNFTKKTNAVMDYTLSAGGLATPVGGSFLNVTIGPRAVQAFQYDPTTTKLTVGKRSPLVYLTVPSGGVPSQTLILQ